MDFETLEMEMNENEIRSNTKIEHKTNIKNKIQQHVFKKLKERQSGHSKISHISYQTFKTQEYMKSHMLNNHEVYVCYLL